MGGSPSTGSSLLVRLLNRHPAIFAGEETYLFLHSQLATNWQKYKQRLISTGKIFGLKSPAWFQFNGVLLEHPDNGWSKEELSTLIREAATYDEFIENYFRKALTINQKQLWIEKSPANSFNFKFFAERNSNNKFIHVIRHPYDVAASLMGRSYDAWSAAGRCIFANAMALRIADFPNYFCISYENLVSNPQAAVAPLLDFLNVPQNDTIFAPSEAEKKEIVSMKGWQHNEKGAIGQSSVGRWKKLPKAQQQLIRAAFSAFQVSPKYVDKYDLKHTDSAAVFEALGYEYLPENPQSYLGQFRATRRKEIWGRTWRLYPSGFGNFMGEIPPSVPLKGETSLRSLHTAVPPFREAEGGKYDTLFLDRDGVINVRIPGEYVTRWEDFQFIEGVPAAIAKYSQIFKRILVVTNQQGIGKGIMTEADLNAVHEQMIKAIEAAGGRIDRVYFCPKLARNKPFCRKPNIGMGRQAKSHFPEIDFSKSIMVGDSLSDIGFGCRLGMKTVLVETNLEELEKLEKEGLKEDWTIDFRMKDLTHLGSILN